MISLRHHTTTLCAALSVALVLRLAAAIWVQHTVSQTPGRLCLIPGDADGYWELGRKLTHGEYSLYDPSRYVMRMPGFPAILAACQFAFGDRLLPTRCVLALIGTIACGLVYWLGCELANRNVGLIALVATAISPSLVIFGPLLLSETAFAAGLLASLLPWARLFAPADQCRTGLAIAAGLLSAIATYLRPTWLPVVPVAAVVLIVIGRSHRARWCEAAITIVTLAAALFPWAYRNHRLTGHWIATTLWVGPSLYDGLNPQATGDSDMLFFENDQLLNRMSEYDMDQEYRRRARDFALRNPGRVIELMFRKATRYWSLFPNAEQFRNPWVSWGLFVATAPLFGLSIVGLLAHRTDWRLLALTAGPVLFFAAVHMIFVGSIRYRLPAEYPLWILAATGVYRWCRPPSAKPEG